MGSSPASLKPAQADELLKTFHTIELRFRATLAGTQLAEMLQQLQAARCLIELAMKGNADGNDMLICANAVILHLRSRIEILRRAKFDRKVVG